MKKQRVVKYTSVGIIATLIDYIIYELIIFLLGDASWAWLATMIAGIIATGAAYLMHSNITWKERDPGKFGIIKFFIWNVLVMVCVRPLLTLVFGLLTGLYEWVFGTGVNIGINWDYNFVESTGIYGFMTIITMILNFTVYERLIFGKKPQKENKNKKAEKVS